MWQWQHVGGLETWRTGRLGSNRGELATQQLAVTIVIPSATPAAARRTSVGAIRRWFGINKHILWRSAVHWAKLTASLLIPS